VASPVAFSSKLTTDQPRVDGDVKGTTSDKPSRPDDKEQRGLREHPSTPVHHDRSYSESFESPSRTDNLVASDAYTADHNDGAGKLFIDTFIEGKYAIISS
jgi:hypothetical protein